MRRAYFRTMAWMLCSNAGESAQDFLPGVAPSPPPPTVLSCLFFWCFPTDRPTKVEIEACPSRCTPESLASCAKKASASVLGANPPYGHGCCTSATLCSTLLNETPALACRSIMLLPILPFSCGTSEKISGCPSIHTKTVRRWFSPAISVPHENKHCLHTNGSPKRGTQQITREENAPYNIGPPPPSSRGTLPPFWGPSKQSPGGHQSTLFMFVSRNY